MAESIIDVLRAAANTIRGFFYNDKSKKNVSDSKPKSDRSKTSTNLPYAVPKILSEKFSTKNIIKTESLSDKRIKYSFVVETLEPIEAARIEVLTGIVDKEKNVKRSKAYKDISTDSLKQEDLSVTLKSRSYDSWKEELDNFLQNIKEKCKDYQTEFEIYQQRIQTARTNRKQIYFSIGIQQIKEGSHTERNSVDNIQLNELKDVIFHKPSAFQALYKDCTLTPKDLKTLTGNNWLNDEVINQYLKLITRRSDTTYLYPTVYNFTTFFFQKLKTSGFDSVRSWTRKVNVFTYDILIIPIFMGAHWCLVTADFKKKVVFYYDSLLNEFYRCLEIIREYLTMEYRRFFSCELDTSDWCFECITIIPQQFNSVDCGVFICTYAEYYARNARFDFSQNDMPYFRDKMLIELANNTL